MYSTSSFLVDRNEKKNRRKSRRWAVLFLLLLLVLLFFPFIQQKVEEEQQLGILIQFDEPPPPLDRAASASQRSSTSQAAAAEEAVEAEATATATPTATPVEPPHPDPETAHPARTVTKTVDPLPTQKSQPLMSTTAPEINLAALMENLSQRAQIKEVSSQVIEVTEEVTNENINAISSYFKNNKKRRSSSTSNSSSTGTSNSPGEGRSGSSESGDANTDGRSDNASGEGPAESGNAGMDFEGDGLLSRKVIHRANLDKLIVQNGKMVINLCVDREGKVIYSEVNRDRSTVTDRSLLELARLTAAKYRYEKDYTVAERQCGTLSFIVKIEQ